MKAPPYQIRLLTLLSAMLAILAPPAAADPAISPAAAAGESGITQQDVVYGNAAGVSLQLDASVPAGVGPFPVCILVHGGGWAGGDKQRQFRPLFAPLTEHGYAWFSINYRLAPAHKYPGSVEDVETAVRWVKAHATEYRVDPNRIALVGESAGGHLVALATTRNSPGCDTKVVVPFYAPTNLVLPDGTKPPASLAAYFGITVADAASNALLRDASPLTHVRAGLPPFLLVHGTADRLVDHQQSVDFQEALRAAGVSCDLITVNDGGHGIASWEKRRLPYRDQVLAWLDQHLK